MLLISHASIVFAPHPGFPLVYTCMVSMSGSTGYQCDGACMDATYRVVIAMQGCQPPRLQILRIDGEGRVDDVIMHGT